MKNDSAKRNALTVITPIFNCAGAQRQNRKNHDLLKFVNQNHIKTQNYCEAR